jgi:hypothetical protein
LTTHSRPYIRDYHIGIGTRLFRNIRFKSIWISWWFFCIDQASWSWTWSSI